MRGVLLALVVGLAGPAWAGEWKTLVTQDGVTVETLDAEGGDTWVRGTGTLDVPYEQLRDAMLSLKRFPTWMPSLTNWKIVRRNEEEAVVYGRHKLPWPMADRDYLVRYTWTEGPDGFVLEARARKAKAPAPNGVVRLLKVHSTWTLTRAGAKTKVVYRYNGDLGGSVPRWAAASGWKSEAPVLFRTIESDLKKKASP